MSYHAGIRFYAFMIMHGSMGNHNRMSTRGRAFLHGRMKMHECFDCMLGGPCMGDDAYLLE